MSGQAPPGCECIEGDGATVDGDGDASGVGPGSPTLDRLFGEIR